LALAQFLVGGLLVLGGLALGAVAFLLPSTVTIVAGILGGAALVTGLTMIFFGYASWKGWTWYWYFAMLVHGLSFVLALKPDLLKSVNPAWTFDANYLTLVIDGLWLYYLWSRRWFFKVRV